MAEPIRPRGIYLLPNLFTTGGLFAGFYAIVAAMQGDFSTAGFAIFIAMLSDGLDGRVARLTNTQSAFGAQYDSLADMVSFGLAPALIVYHWGLASLGKVGWLTAFVFAACAALRLARFNIQLTKVDRRYFIGLASPAAAGLVTGMVWAGNEYHVPGHEVSLIALGITLLAALLMVSTFRYYSFKKWDFKGKVPYVAVLLVLLSYVAISIDPPQILFYAFLGYAFSGPVAYFLRRRRLKRARSFGSADNSLDKGM